MRHEHAAPPEAWDAIAEGYDLHVAPQEADLADEALDLAGLRAGERFLDVAAGPGGLALPAARRGAEVLAADWSPAMIARFAARAEAEGLGNARGRVMDCHALDLPDDGFDVVGSQFGVMLVPDQAGALREMVRVARPGGRVFLTAYGAPAGFEVLGCFLDALAVVDPAFPGLPDDPPPLEFQVADPAVLRRRLEEAGLAGVRVARTAERPSFATGRDLWDWAVSGNPIPAMVVADLTDAQREAMVRELEAAVRARADGGGRATLENAVHIGVGTKPV